MNFRRTSANTAITNVYFIFLRIFNRFKCPICQTVRVYFSLLHLKNSWCKQNKQNKHFKNNLNKFNNLKKYTPQIRFIHVQSINKSKS